MGARFVHNGVPTWFFGEVKSGAPSKWSVVFDDGDEKTVPEYLLKHEDQVKLEQQDAAQVAAVEEKLCLELLASTHRVQEAGTQLAYGFDQLAKEATSSDETAKVKAEVKTEAKTEARTEAKSVELSATKEDPQPLPPASRPKVHVKVEYEEHSCQVKDEHEQEAKGGAKRIKDAHTMSREALRRRLQFEPDGVTPRAVFRAGCHPRCLTQVLGGEGTDNQRFVREDKVLPDGHVLIREGEMYLWGRADWNTYAPSFAGDVGAYRDDLQQDLKDQQLAMGWAEPQAVFHLFRECTKRFLIDMPLSAYHGKDAEKKTLYCGRYRVDNEITYQQTFNELLRAHRSVSASSQPGARSAAARPPRHSASAVRGTSWPRRHGRISCIPCMVSSSSTTMRSSTGLSWPRAQATDAWKSMMSSLALFRTAKSRRLPGYRAPVRLVSL